jgi:hypothetical protein
MSKVKDVKSSPIKVTLTDGVERELRFTLNAMAELEDKYGSVEKAFNALEENSIKALRFILFVGLMADDTDLTEQQVGNLIDMQSMETLMAALTEAFGNDMPADSKKEAIEDPNA